MSADMFGVIELIGVFGLVIGVLVWQLVSVRRSMREDRDKAERERDGAP